MSRATAPRGEAGGDGDEHALATLFASDFLPHGHCYRWEPAVLWLNVGSDALIALAYYSIPTSLATFSRRRPDIGSSG
jgi:hypothetical protein